MTTNVRPTQARLLLALLPATIIVALMLQFLAAVLYTQTLRFEILSTDSRTLSVLLSRPERPAEPRVEATPQSVRQDDQQVGREPARSEPGLSASDTPLEEPRIDVTESDVDARPRLSTSNWYRLAKTASAEYLEHLHADESRKAERWRTSGSVLFAPREDMPSVSESDLLPEYRFVEPVGVVGLGLTIGQCFVGLPLIGIPVEDRTPMVVPLYCRR